MESSMGKSTIVVLLGHSPLIVRSKPGAILISVDGADALVSIILDIINEAPSMAHSIEYKANSSFLVWRRRKDADRIRRLVVIEVCRDDHEICSWSGRYCGQLARFPERRVA